jgi:hypothetical protein
MKASGDIVAVRRQFEQSLEPARRCLHRSRVTTGLSRAFRRTVWTMAGLAGAFLFVRVVAWATDGPALPSGVHLLWFILVAGGVVLFGSMLPLYRQRPSLTQAAERLDLAAGIHNRVATGLAFVARDQQTAFTRAAIVDGLVQLQKIKDEAPFVPAARVPWRQMGAVAALCVALSMIGALIPQPPEFVRDQEEPAPAVAARGEEPTRSGGTSAERAKRTTPPKRPEKTTAVAPVGARKIAVGGSPVPAAAPSALGFSGAGGASASLRMDRSATSGGGAPGLSTSSGVSGEDRRKGGAPRLGRAPRESSRRTTDEKGGGAAVSAGSPGAGALTPTHHDWALREQSAARDEEDEDSDEPTERERRSSTQRGGMQPSLKDRREAPSRELGISGDQGRPGTGRGGPTPPKKSRGTASLVLGVPVPDFVRGRLGRGPTKVTKEHGRPVPATGRPAVEAMVRPRSLPETSCRRRDVPSEYAAVVRRYLVALHEAAEASATRENSGFATGQHRAE